MSLEILEKNWKSIEKRVIKPLWNNEFKSMYESLKLDYDDYISMVGYELSKAFLKFDESMSNLYTFSTNVVKRKGRTELRDYGKRDKRKTLSCSTSLNNLVSEDDKEQIIDRLECKENTFAADNELSEKRVGNFVCSLSNQQLRVLILKLLGFENGDMIKMLNMSRGTMTDILKGLKRSEITRILYRRKF